MGTSSVAPISTRDGDGGPIDEHLEISLFGTLALRWGGRPVALRLPQQAIRLLAYILLHRDRALAREHVAFTLWPDDDEADARANLRRKLHLLARALPAGREPWIVTTPTTIGWNGAAPYALDTARFELLGAAHAASSEADALYGGDLLVDLYDDWIVRERDRLRTIAMDNLVALIAYHQKQRDFAGAVRFAQRLRGLDPWREDAVRALIALRYESGDRAGALSEYERFRVELAAEMGVEPMPETVCVYERVLAHAPAAPATAAPRESPGSPRGPTGLPFVGRERELNELIAAWTDASGGSGGALLIAGEAGIGKSRLVEEFATVVEANGGRVLRGGTTPFELGPYQPFSEALRSALPILRETRVDALWLAVLATLVPQLRVIFPDLRPITPLDAEPERMRLFEAVEVAVSALSANRPMVLILEDIHWAGAATVSLLEHVARHAILHRILIVATFREEELLRTHPLRALRRRLERERLLRVVALGPLEAAAIAHIVDTFVDADDTERADITRYLRDASDGNPFFLGELIANDHESGSYDGATRRWLRAAVPAGVPVSLPSTMSARLERLPQRVRSVAEVAAVIGRSFSAELVREMSGIDERSTLDSLGELIDRRLIREVASGGTDFAFSHQLIQQAVYAEMAPAARQRRHRRVGNVIEELYGERLEQFAAEIASHFDRAGESEHAAEYYCLAARQALSLHGCEEAQTLAARGRELAHDPGLRFRAIEVLEEASRRLGDRDAQRNCVTQLLAIADACDDPQLEREALRRQIVLAHDCAERDQERAAIAALEARLPGARDEWTATFAGLKGSYLTAIGSYREARAVMSNALANVSAADHPRVFVECRCALVQLARFEGRVDDVRAFLAEVATFETSYDRARAVTLLETACTAATSIQDYAALSTCAERLLACSRAIGYRAGEAAAYAYVGRAALRLFEIDRAREFLARAIAMFATIGQPLKQFDPIIEMGNLSTTIGRFDDAIAHFEAASAIARSISYTFGEAVCANNISYTAYLKGDFDHARRAARKALDAAELIESPSARAHALVSMGVAERELADLAASILHLEAGTDLERRLNETAALGEDLCELIVALLRNNQNDRAATLTEELLTLADGSAKQSSHLHKLLWTAALVHHLNGDGQKAHALLARARRTLDELQAAIPDPESRIMFRNLRFNRAIDNAFDRDHWVTE